MEALMEDTAVSMESLMGIDQTMTVDLPTWAGGDTEYVMGGKDFTIRNKREEGRQKTPTSTMATVSAAVHPFQEHPVRETRHSFNAVAATPLVFQEHPIPGTRHSLHPTSTRDKFKAASFGIPVGGVGLGFGRLCGVLRELAHAFYILHLQLTDSIRRKTGEIQEQEGGFLDAADVFSARSRARDRGQQS